MTWWLAIPIGFFSFTCFIFFAIILAKMFEETSWSKRIFRIILAGTLLGFSLASVVIIIWGIDGIIPAGLLWIGGFIVGTFFAHKQWIEYSVYVKPLNRYLLSKLDNKDK